MNDLDQMIRDALAEDEAERLDAVSGPQSLFQQAISLLKDSERWLIVLVVGAQLGFIAVMFGSAWSFFQVPETDLKAQLTRLGVFAFACMAISMIKLWSWMEINKNAVTREVKRLELQVAYLSKRLSNDNTESSPQ